MHTYDSSGGAQDEDQDGQPQSSAEDARVPLVQHPGAVGLDEQSVSRMMYDNIQGEFQ